MTDRFLFRSPLGPLGTLADRIFLERYMRGFLVEHARMLKSAAESNAWRTFLPDDQQHPPG